MHTSGRQVLGIGILTRFSSLETTISHQKQTWEMMSVTQKDKRGELDFSQFVSSVSSTRIKKRLVLWVEHFCSDSPDSSTQTAVHHFILFSVLAFPWAFEFPQTKAFFFFFFWHSTAFFPAKLLFSEDFSTCSWVVLKMFSDFHNQSCRVRDSLL